MKNKLTWEQSKAVLCICGHEMYWHLTAEGECDGPTPENGKVVFCPCLKFKQDNLKYLEDKYNEKTTTSLS